MWNKRGGLNNDINIKTFNAIGNGSSSDVASIQSAINAATKGSNYFNRNITIPSGNYVIDSNLTIPSSVSLKIQQEIGVSSITVGASPFTYTAGYSPETIYVDGGTVSSITKGGITIATSTGRAIQLEPNESIVVTYSATPTMTADKH
jgi:polygalacturonase